MSKTYKEKYDEILDGWTNWLFKNESVEEVAKERAEVCAKCPSNVNNTCKECGCPLFAKTRSMKETNKCDLGKWESQEN